MSHPPEFRPLCVAPFAALTVSADGGVSPCCEFVGPVGSLRDNSLREIWESEKLRDLRRAIASGEKVKACWKCWEVEEANGSSLRQSLNSRFAHRLPQSPSEAASLPENPVYLDIRFSNLCNFRCRTCHHGASSRWFSDAKALGLTESRKALLSAFDPKKNAQMQFEEIGENVTDLYFAGGEPLMEKQHFELLRWLIAQKRTDIRLNYNTNLSTLNFEGSDLINLWQEFRNLNVEASIDAVGSAGALIRRGFDWEIFRANLDRLHKECPQVAVKIGVTVSVFNILKLTELHSILVNECGVSPESFNFHPVQIPRYYDIAILPEDIKERAMVQIEAYAAMLSAQNPQSPVAAQLHHVVEHMIVDAAKDPQENLRTQREKFIDITAQLDKLRSEDTKTRFPELATLFS